MNREEIIEKLSSVRGYACGLKESSGGGESSRRYGNIERVLTECIDALKEIWSIEDSKDNDITKEHNMYSGIDIGKDNQCGHNWVYSDLLSMPPIHTRRCTKCGKTQYLPSSTSTGEWIDGNGY